MSCRKFRTSWRLNVVIFGQHYHLRHRLLPSPGAGESRLFVWFGASLNAALRAAAAGAARLGPVAQSGTVVIAVGLAVYVTFGVAIVSTVDDVPASTTQTLNVLNGEAPYAFFAIGTALLVSAAGLAVLRYGGLPRWVGWTSVTHGTVAITVLVAGAFVPGLGFVAFLLLVYWIPLIAIVTYQRDIGAATTSPAVHPSSRPSPRR